MVKIVAVKRLKIVFVFIFFNSITVFAQTPKPCLPKYLDNSFEFEKLLFSTYSKLPSDSSFILTSIMSSNGYSGRAIIGYIEKGKVYAYVYRTKVYSKTLVYYERKATKKVLKMAKMYYEKKMYLKEFKNEEFNGVNFDHPVVNKLFSTANTDCKEMHYVSENNNDPLIEWCSQILKKIGY